MQGNNPGASTHLGGKPTQQDAYLVAKDDARQQLVLGVFDGHGAEGHKSANFVKGAMISALAKVGAQLENDPSEAVVAAFHAVQLDLLENEGIDSYMSGTTATIAIVDSSRNRLIVANAGDSRAVLIRSTSSSLWTAEAITKDHTCANQEEFLRVTKAGARVDKSDSSSADGPLRIFKGTLPYPGLVVTRSLGDSVASRIGVIPTPDVYVIPIVPDMKALVLASDGVWDGLTSEQTSNIAKEFAPNRDAATASNSVIIQALAGLAAIELDDNVTSVFYYFK